MIFQEHKSKLLMFTALVTIISIISSIMCIIVKVVQVTRARSRPHHPALDTVSSDLELSVDLQLVHQSDHQLLDSAAAVSSSSCQTLLAKSEFKPKGILKNSRTSENFRLVQNILNFYDSDILLK